MIVMIEHPPTDSEYVEVIMVSRIVRLRKSMDGEATLIHLDTGEVIASEDSIKTLQARINLACSAS